MSTPGIADSDAVLLENRILSQHQAALTLLQTRLSSPDVETVSWLDLACGKGQIVAQLDKNIAANLRSKIIYSGYDLKLEHVKITERKAQQLAFKAATFKVGDLSDFSKAFPEDVAFDFITLTNTVHEIEPHRVGAVLFDALARLSGDGLLFVYDMEQLQIQELGAVSWKSSEIAAVMGTLLSHIGVRNYEAPVSHWTHSKVTGWSFQVDNKHIVKEATPNFRQSRDATLSAVSQKVREILGRRLQVCTNTLESLTRHGSVTGTEKDQETASLYEFWALRRALENTNE